MQSKPATLWRGKARFAGCTAVLSLFAVLHASDSRPPCEVAATTSKSAKPELDYICSVEIMKKFATILCWLLIMLVLASSLTRDDPYSYVTDDTNLFEQGFGNGATRENLF